MIMNISERAVREIERRAFEKLRQHPALKEFKEFWREYQTGEIKEADLLQFNRCVLSPAEISEQEATEWTELSLRIRSLLQPVGELEELSVDEVTANWFRLARCLKIDTGLFRAYSQYQGKACGLGTAFAQAAQLDCFGKLSRYEQHLERKLALSLQRFQSVRSVRRSRPEPPGAEQVAQAVVGPVPVSPGATGDAIQHNPAKAPESATDRWRQRLAKMTARWPGAAARLSRFGLFGP